MTDVPLLHTCLEAQHAWHTVIYWVFFPTFTDVFCELEVIKVYSKMLLFENINQNLMFVSASIRFLKTDHYFDTDFCIINMFHLRSLHHSPFYLYFFLPNSKPSLFQQFEFTQRVHKFKLRFQFWGGQSWNVHLCSRQNNCTCPGWKVNTCKHTQTYHVFLTAQMWLQASPPFWSTPFYAFCSKGKQTLWIFYTE